MQALTKKRVDFEGEFFRFKNVPFEVWPFQQPHPPLWYGVVNPGQRRARRQGRDELHQQFDRGDGEGQGRALHAPPTRPSPARKRRNSA